MTQQDTQTVTFEQVVDACYSPMLHWLTGLTGHMEWAEDITQEAMLRTLQSWHRFTGGPQDAKNYVYRIAANLLHDQRRHGAVLRVVSLDEPLPVSRRRYRDFLRTDDDTAALAIRLVEPLTEQQMAFRAAFRGLPRPDRQVLRLAYGTPARIAGGHAAISSTADALGIPGETAKSRVYRARLRLRLLLLPPTEPAPSCLSCGRAIVHTRRTTARYCNRACQSRAGRQRRHLTQQTSHEKEAA